MLRTSMLLVMLLALPFSLHSEVVKGHYVISSQLSDWCVGDVGQQNFCHGFLMGVYDSGNCKEVQETPDWEELKHVFVKWVFVKKDDAFVSAQLSAKTAFKEEYGCE